MARKTPLFLEKRSCYQPPSQNPLRGRFKGSPMKAAHFRCALLLCGTSVLAVLESGCTVGRKTFSLDSTSRMPFFGLELKERGPKPPDPKYSSISRSTTDGSRVQSMLRVGTQSSTTTGGQLVAVNDSSSEVAAPVLSPVTLDKQQNQPATSIPLPMAQSRGATSSGELSTGFVDFQ